jgi:hypothetical protein
MNHENNKSNFSIDTFAGTSISGNHYYLKSTIAAVDPCDSLKIAELERMISHYREIILRRCPEELI